MGKTNLGLTAALVAALTFAGCTGSSSSKSSSVSEGKKQEVLETYARIATANYEDAYNDAVALQDAISVFTTTPNGTNFEAAKEAWLTARESYGTTEIFRLSNGPIDAEDGWVADLYGAPEGQINAWPLDESMIDYTTDANDVNTTDNIIDTAGSFTPSGGTAVDVTTITKAALTELNENGGDANVATGFHAIEFLLWGQDQDYGSFIDDDITKGALVAGLRSYTDFTTAPNAARRVAFLQAAAGKLVDDLKVMKDAWASTQTPNCATGVGCYRAAFLGKLTGSDAGKNLTTAKALENVTYGMGVFLKSELANERIAVAVQTPSEEDEHSCFSDNTHRDIDLNYQGFKNALMGTYKGISQGTSFYSQLSSANKTKIDDLIDAIDPEVEAVNEIAQSDRHFDYQIKPADAQMTKIRDMKNDMRDLADLMIPVAKTFGVTLTTVTDPDETPL